MIISADKSQDCFKLYILGSVFLFSALTDFLFIVYNDFPTQKYSNGDVHSVSIKVIPLHGGLCIKESIDWMFPGWMQTQINPKSAANRISTNKFLFSCTRCILKISKSWIFPA